jgi:ABC-type transporter Mla maintaining outer membrane lipid asymmetry ATPase subunit MlaF
MPPAMPDTATVAVELRDVRKDYRTLRPLRVRALDLRVGESIALLGFDRASAEVLVNLITAATVPDDGEVRVFGRPTASILDADSWLTSLDIFGIVSERAVVLDNMSVADNLTMPLTMAVHDMDTATRAKVKAIAEEVGLSRDDLARPVAALTSSGRLRLRLGRAIAPDPRIVLAEHPNAMLEPSDAAAFASDYARIVANRGIASILLTADVGFAAAVTSRILTLQPATGELKRLSAWRRVFAR